MEKKILIIRRYKGFGGIEHQIKTLSDELIKRSWEVYLLTDVDSPFSTTLKEQGVNVIVKQFGNMINTARIIKSLCKSENIRIIQSHMLNEDFRCRIARFLMPSLRHVFRVHTYIDCSNISETKKRIYHLLSKITDPFVDIYVSINEFNAIELRNKTRIKDSKIRVIHDAVREFDKLKDNLNFSRTKHIAMIANYDCGKGHDVAVMAIKKLKEAGKEYFLHIIGGVPGRGTDREDSSTLDRIKNLILELGLSNSIILEGYTNDIQKKLDICDCVILPSYSEGTPNCLLEGMLLGKIVISSCVGGVPEFVHNKETGFTFLPNTADCLAEAISEVYSFNDEELDEILFNARCVVDREYSKESVGEKMSNLYSSML